MLTPYVLVDLPKSPNKSFSLNVITVLVDLYSVNDFLPPYYSRARCASQLELPGQDGTQLSTVTNWMLRGTDKSEPGFSCKSTMIVTFTDEFTTSIFLTLDRPLNGRVSDSDFGRTTFDFPALHQLSFDVRLTVFAVTDGNYFEPFVWQSYQSSREHIHPIS